MKVKIITSRRKCCKRQEKVMNLALKFGDRVQLKAGDTNIWRIWDTDGSTARVALQGGTTDRLTLGEDWNAEKSANDWLNIASHTDPNGRPTSGNKILEFCKDYMNNNYSDIVTKFGKIDCMTVEDINKKTGFEPLEDYDGYGTSYEYSDGTFLAYENGGSTAIGKKVAGRKNKVTGKSTYYYYYIADNAENATLREILGPSYCWLASPCVYCNSNGAGFHVRDASGSSVGSNGLFSSYGGADSPAYGVRPLVSLSSMLLEEDPETPGTYRLK